MNETPVSRAFRDGRLASIAGGAEEVMLTILSQRHGDFAGHGAVAGLPLGVSAATTLVGRPTFCAMARPSRSPVVRLGCGVTASG